MLKRRSNRSAYNNTTLLNTVVIKCNNQSYLLLNILVLSLWTVLGEPYNYGYFKMKKPYEYINSRVEKFYKYEYFNIKESYR